MDATFRLEGVVGKGRQLLKRNNKITLILPHCCSETSYWCKLGVRKGENISDSSSWAVSTASMSSPALKTRTGAVIKKRTVSTVQESLREVNASAVGSIPALLL